MRRAKTASTGRLKSNVGGVEFLTRKSNTYSMEILMVVTSKGQVTIPAWIREQKGFLPQTEVAFKVDGDVVKLVKVETSERRGQRLVAGLQGRADTGVSTEDIMALTRSDS